MRNHVSFNQLVLWTHHKLSQAWTPTGIVHPPQTGSSPAGEVDEDLLTAGCVDVEQLPGGATSALTCARGRWRRRRASPA